MSGLGLGAQGQMAEAIIADIVAKQISNQIQFLLTILAKYDPDTLGILGDLEGDKRYVVAMRIKQAYVVIGIEILETEALIERLEVRIKVYDTEAELSDDDLKSGYHAKDSQKWINYNIFNKMWLAIWEGLLTQGKSQFAMLRGIAVIQAWESMKKKGMFFGKTQDAIKEVQKQLGMAKDGKKGVQLSDGEEKKALELGLDPALMQGEGATASG